AKQYPNARTFRTRLETSISPHHPVAGETPEAPVTDLNHHSKGDINHV
ncbi:MAG: hypothetical protein H0X26_09935, partial [Alphaproteobacteria bacterium]|nr:hypothetical protein [Alphaproteobacteria bacterium]